jgi:RimJ/RimL family protein N-acetyltransferase
MTGPCAMLPEMPLEPARIETARLALEPISRSQAESILAGDLSSLRRGAGWPHAETSNGLRRALENGGPHGWLVTRDGVVIGDCGTHGEPNDAGEIEIGYALAKPYHGEGYGSELVAALSRWMLEEARVRRVIARVEPGNVASRRALERAGFALESDDGTHLRYALATGADGESAS